MEIEMTSTKRIGQQEIDIPLALRMRSLPTPTG
jgi:hypothetical protein